MSEGALSPSQEALAPVEAVSPEQLPDYQPAIRGQKREAWSEVAALVSLWLLSRWLYRDIANSLAGFVILNIAILFERKPASAGMTGAPSCELASEDQSRRYWDRVRFAQKGRWLFYAMLLGCLVSSKFLPSPYDVGVAVTLLAGSIITLIVSAFGRDCPRCLERLSAGHIRGHCNKCGIFFRTERKAAQ